MPAHGDQFSVLQIMLYAHCSGCQTLPLPPGAPYTSLSRAVALHWRKSAHARLYLEVSRDNLDSTTGSKLLASGGHWLWMKVEAVDAAEHPPTCRAALWQRMVDY